MGNFGQNRFQVFGDLGNGHFWYGMKKKYHSWEECMNLREVKEKSAYRKRWGDHLSQENDIPTSDSENNLDREKVYLN
ncbi:hypothetical protein HNY73_008999 [Argiope bruennichi]|uniref:Uncharacterized protein n=1 Tax=Argiope bruennichi TaxID=94029 RepID=A0A8T0FAU8_ARGBR|nr:hypothetical protein HNY73_008999 [Argiope bruennichi]